ncbi:MFS transporter [Streptomyces sp. QTS52]
MSSLAVGLAFLPMMVLGMCLTPFSARLVERLGPRLPITTGLLSMAVGLALLGVHPASTPVWALALVMILVGRLAGPLVKPPGMAVLLDSVSAHRAGTVSGVCNTSRQVGGALAVAVFGTLLANRATFLHGLHISLLIAAVVLLATAAGSLLLKPIGDERWRSAGALPQGPTVQNARRAGSRATACPVPQSRR